MKTRTNVQMVDLYVLRKRVSMRDDRIKELEKLLNRTVREIETLQAQLGCNQSDGLMERCREALNTPMKEIY
jgi:predicted RNase H-like nuclease (RuvC/YqgF family)